MKMIFAIIRPEKHYDTVKAVSEKGYNAFTHWNVAGRGRQKGIQVGDVVYEEMAKNALIMIVDDEDKDDVIDIIMQSAITGESGNSGDGKVFVLPIEEGYTISTQSKD